MNQFPCISETFILNQITGLIDRGHTVNIYASEPSNESKIHEDVVRYDLIGRTIYYGNEKDNIPGNRVKRLRKSIHAVKSHFTKNPAAFINSMNIFKYKKQAANLKMLLKMVPFLGNGDYDVVHCHFGPNGNLAVLLKELGVFTGKIVTVFHGYDISRLPRKHGKEIYNDLFQKGDLFLPISETWKNELISMGCREDKIAVHHMGIDPKKYDFSRQRRKDRDTIKVVSIGRFVEKKGIQYGIEAMGIVMKKHNNVEYIIIGDGELRDAIEKTVSRLDLGERIRLLGWKSQEEILSCMEDADILLAPSVTSEDGDQEGIPVVLMEAMAMGLPVVSTRHSGIPELVRDHVSGFLAPERNVPVLAEIMNHCILNRDQWPVLGMAGHKEVIKNFNISMLNDRLVDVFRHLVNSKGSTAPAI
ncbi:MAG: glycosyltransferase [Anaerolineales bacterium]|nr:glycosyltransferase [Anaerolineales bacterium]